LSSPRCIEITTRGLIDRPDIDRVATILAAKRKSHSVG